MKRFPIENPESAPPVSWITRLTGFDLGNRGLAASGVSIITAGALLTGVVPGVELGGSQPIEQLPALPEFASVPANTDGPVFPDDGLTRLVVTPTTARLTFLPTALDTPAPDQPSGSKTIAPAPPTVPGTNDSESDNDNDGGLGELSELEGLENAPDGSSLVVTETGLAVRYPDGTIVPLDDVIDPDAVTEADPAADDADAPSLRTLQEEALAELPATASMADQLASLPGVETATAVGDGSYAVALSDPEALDGFALEVADEAYLAAFAEPYESLEWYIENDGVSMVRYNQASTVDADIDGTVAIQHATGSGIVVAVIDTGVDFSHPDLASRAWVNGGEVCDDGVDNDGNGYVDDCNGFDFMYRDGVGYNSGASAHGTHVAGSIAAARNDIGVAGVAPDARIMDLNVSRVDGSMTGSAVSEAIRYGADNGADVINMSLGTNPGASDYQPIGTAIDYAATKGVLVIVAAGNDNVNLSNINVWPASYDKPNMMTVGASSPDDSKASFSNYGGPVDIFAPGEMILSTVPASSGSYNFMSGTSMASPVTAASAALLLSDDPSLTPEEVIEVLRSTSDIGPELESFAADGRRVNAGEALGGAIDDDTPITELAVSMTGLANITAGEPLTSDLRFEVPDDAFTEDYRWELVLLANETEGAYALIDQTIEVNGETLDTGETGSVELGLTGTGGAVISTTLPAGDYGLLLEAVPTADPTTRLGYPFVATFTVRSEATTPTPDQPTSNTGGGSSDDGGADGGTTDGGSTTPGTPSTGTPSTGGSTGGDSGTTTGGTTTGGNQGTGGTSGGDSSDGGTSDGGTSPDTGTQTPADPDTGTPAPGTGEQPSNPVDNPSTDDGVDSAPAPGPNQPPSNGNPGSQPTMPTTEPDPVANGGYAARTVSPYVGPLGEQTRVTIAGDFPDPVQVFFGAIESSSVSQTTSRIVALSPAGTRAETVDIRLVRNGTTVLTIGGGYTYQSTDTGSSTPPSNGSGDSGTGDSNSGDSGTGDSGTGDSTGSTPGTPSAPGGGTGGSPDSGSPDSGSPDTGSPDSGDGDSGDDDEGDTSTPTTTPRPRARQARGTVGGERVDFGNGLTGAPYGGGNPLASVTPCRSNTCAATTR